MIALVLSAVLLTGASAQSCVSDSRLAALTKEDFSNREDIQAFSKDGMWKMPDLVRRATEEELDDCASCTDAEVQLELMLAQVGETSLDYKIDGIYYPVENKWTEKGFRLGWKDIPHDVPEKIKKLLEHRAGTLEIEITAYRQLAFDEAEKLAHNNEEVEHVAPAGFGPHFELVQAKMEQNLTKKKLAEAQAVKIAATQSLAEYASHVRVLRDIEKTSSKGSGVYLILREGFVMDKNFKSQYKKIVSEAPKDWDVLFLSNGKGKTHLTRCEDQVPGMNLFEMRRPRTTPDGKDKFYAGGIDGYLVRKQSIPKILQMLRHTKAAPLTELLMSVHSEEKEHVSNGKINYNVEGVYSYMVTDKMLDTVDVPRPPQKVEVKEKKEEKQEGDEKDQKKTQKDQKSVPQKKTSKFLQLW